MLKKMLCTFALVTCVFGLQAEETQDKELSTEILAACDSSDENCDNAEGALALFNENDDEETSNPGEFLACKNCD